MGNRSEAAEKWAIEFYACNEIIRGIGMEAYELTMQEEEPVKKTIELIRERQGWIHEDGGGYSS
jgi:hypothetical protein